MKVVIINAYGKSPQQLKKFSTYYQILQEVLQEQLYNGNDYQEYVLAQDELNEYLHQEFSTDLNYTGLSKFKLIDYIFIEGPLPQLPWLKKYQNLMIFVRMCIKYNKVFFQLKRVFATGLAFSCFLYSLATTLALKHTIKNPFGSNYQQIFLQQPQYQKNTFYLQKSTGDLYHFDSYTQRWETIYNCGMHHRKAAQNTIFRKMVHKQKTKGVLLPLYYEIIPQKKYLQDPLLQDLNFPLSFYSHNKWQAHKILIEGKYLLFNYNENPMGFASKNIFGIFMLVCNNKSQVGKLIKNWLNQQFKQQCLIDDNQKYQSIKTNKSYNQNYPSRKQCIEVNPLIALLKSDLQKHKFTKTISTNLKKISNNFSSIKSTRANKFKQNYVTLKIKLQSIDKSSVLCSGPYETQDEVYTREMKQRDKKKLNGRWITYKKIDQSYIKNYVVLSASKRYNDHKFRQQMKQKWICGNFI